VNNAPAKIALISFPITLWLLIRENGFGWFTVITILPMTFLVALGLAAILEWIIEPLVRWINK
jgi:hypothetical protein